jgi:hypothetical protein
MEGCAHIASRAALDNLDVIGGGARKRIAWMRCGYNALKSSGTSPNFLITLASLKSAAHQYG